MLRSGGVERWLVDLCPAGRAQNLDMDIAVVWDTGGLFTDKARALGIPLYHCPARNPFSFIRGLRRLLRERGPYDALHCHIHAYSGFGVLAAWLEGVPARVVHSHNVVGNSSKSLSRRAYIALARGLIRAFATAGIGPSAASIEDLIGPGWRNDARWSAMPCGIDLEPFRFSIPQLSRRAEFGIPPDALVLGSVGRLCAEKNSELLVDILGAVLRDSGNAYMLLIGEGPLRSRLEQQAREGGFGDRLILPGTRPDVPALLRTVMDVFLFPSPPPPRGNEALPIALVEAQAAGLPCVISDGIPPEAVIIPELVAQVASTAGANTWAATALAQARLRDPGRAHRAFEILQNSSFNVAVNMKALAALYRVSSPERSGRTVTSAGKAVGRAVGE